jgi:hypothetical protein
METDETEISQNVRESFPDEWDEWVLASLTDLETSEAAIAQSKFVEELPSWAKSMLEELIKPMLPSIKLEADEQTGPAFLGKLIGHQEYLLESDEAGEAFERQLHTLATTTERIDSFVQKHHAEEQLKMHAELGEEITAYWAAGMEHLFSVMEKKSEAIKRCRTRAFEQPFEVAQEFNNVYAVAQSTPLYNDQGNIERLSNWNKVMLALVTFKPLVERKECFRNLPELHRWIVKIHGYSIISFASFKELCRQHGLKLATRGRPKNSQKTNRSNLPI